MASARISIQAKSSLCSGDEFIADVLVDSRDAAINAGEGSIAYDDAVLELVSINYGGSVFRYWQTQPSETREGVISFTGGIPYPGFTGSGKVFSAVFRAKAAASSQLSVGRESALLLNDGNATPAEVSFADAVIDIRDRALESCVSEPVVRIVQEDTTPPEPFEVIIERNEKIFGGEYFAAFDTTDSGTGVQHYEMSEVSPFVRSPFRKVRSPQRLITQGGEVTVTVRAVDGAGNFRIASATAHLEGTAEPGAGLIAVMFIGALLWFAIIRWCRVRE